MPDRHRADAAPGAGPPRVPGEPTADADAEAARPDSSGAAPDDLSTGTSPADRERPREPEPDEALPMSGPYAPPGELTTPEPPTVPTRGSEDRPLVVRRADTRVPMWLDTAAQYAWRGLVLIVGLAAALYAVTRLYLVTLPVILALVLCTLFVPPARRLERRGVPRLGAAGIVVLGGFGAFAGLVTLLAPTFIVQAQELGPTIQTATTDVLIWLEETFGYDRAQVEAFARDTFATLEGFTSTVVSQIGSIAVAVGEALTALSLAAVLLFFFIKDGGQIVDWFLRLTPAQHRDDVRAVGTRGWVALSGFIRGTAAVALIDAVGIGIGLAIVGVPLVLPLSLLVFFGGFVPVVGAFVTGILAVLVALASNGLQSALIVTGIVIAVQQIESNVLQPTIMRRAVALHPVVTLTVLVAGTMLIGIIGAFLAVPVTAVIAAVANELRLRKEARRLGIEVGPQPLGGPGVDQELLMPTYPESRPSRSRRRSREGAEGRRRVGAGTVGRRRPGGAAGSGRRRLRPERASDTPVAADAGRTDQAADPDGTEPTPDLDGTDPAPDPDATADDRREAAVIEAEDPNAAPQGPIPEEGEPPVRP
jgi:putative heme transporter